MALRHLFKIQIHEPFFSRYGFDSKINLELIWGLDVFWIITMTVCLFHGWLVSTAHKQRH